MPGEYKPRGRGSKKLEWRKKRNKKMKEMQQRHNRNEARWLNEGGEPNDG